MVMSRGLITKRTARLKIEVMWLRLLKIRSLFTGAMRCELYAQSFNCLLQLTTQNRWIASIEKEKEDHGVPFLDDIINGLYIIEARSLRAGLPPLDLPTTKDFFAFIRSPVTASLTLD